MPKITQIELNSLNRNFASFQTRTKESQRQNYSYFVSQLNKFEKGYKRAGLQEMFAQCIYEFAESLYSMGIPDLPGIIYSCLSKMSSLQPQALEFYIKRGLEYAREQGDSIHILARLVDLEKLYIRTKQSHRRVVVLFEEEKELAKICANFQEAKDNYKSFSRENSSRKKYETELAKTRVDIAKVIIKSNPNKAKVLLEKAKKTFEREKRKKEVDFIEDMLSQIN